MDDTRQHCLVVEEKIMRTWKRWRYIRLGCPVTRYTSLAPLLCILLYILLCNVEGWSYSIPFVHNTFNSIVSHIFLLAITVRKWNTVSPSLSITMCTIIFPLLPSSKTEKGKKTEMTDVPGGDKSRKRNYTTRDRKRTSYTDYLYVTSLLCNPVLKRTGRALGLQ